MSKGKRSRGRGGHPAKVAARRARERPRGGDSMPGEIAGRMCREAAEFDDPLAAELWASLILGVFWMRRHELPLEDAGDWALTYGEPLIRAIAKHGGAGAQIALTAIERVDDGELGMRAGELAAGVGDPDGSVPEWVADIGEAELVRAAVMREQVFDDGFTVWIEARHHDAERHAIGVYIDNNLGVMAKDALVADSIESVERIMRDNPEQEGGELLMEPLALQAAAAQIHAAIGLTDMTLGAPVDEDYARLRAVALLRADEATGPRVGAPERPEMPHDERDRLRDEFLASPEGREFPPGGDEAYIAELAIGFCVDYVDGRPLRWSPVVIELFMANWIPRKVLAERDLLECVPAALDAWVRFAGRRAGTPGWAIELTREAIPRWRDEMLQRSDDDATAGPGKQLLTAAKDAGIDFEDEDAFATFIAGWNARSDA
jgi:hypothetical protein